MFDKRHFNYDFIFTASSNNNTKIYKISGSSDDMIEIFNKIKELFYQDFNEYPTSVHRDSAVRV